MNARPDAIPRCRSCLSARVVAPQSEWQVPAHGLRSAHELPHFCASPRDLSNREQLAQTGHRDRRQAG
jgi:hypothetical protein